jgi:hypothetical protein
MAVLAVVYIPTATWSGDLNVDAQAAAAPAWHLATHGNIYVEDLTWNPWYIDAGAHTVSNRPPGVILWTLPWYALFRDPTTFTVWQSTLSAVLAAIMAMGVLHLVLLRLTTPSRAFFAALVMGLGTATWAVSADQLWPHAPNQLCVALAALALASGRAFWSGVALGVGVMVRPPVAFLAAGVGTAKSWFGHSLKPVVLVGAGSSIGLTGLLLYNRVLYSRWTVIGGYPSTFTDRLTNLSLGSYLQNVLAALVDPNNGFLIWSPFLLVLLPGLVTAWNAAPTWVKSLAIGAVVYLLVHLHLNRASGGMPFDYRYPLAPLVALAPLLLLAYTTWVEPRPFIRKLLLVTILVSFLAQGLVATALQCVPGAAGEAICSFF